ncbi:MAG: chromosomal replication initiator protein DnaA [Oscillospiraceae bacterium]|jgi:chromosomal replication initiator protein|nr:chromosomal replication initiator protein DnaA [Oscillospiraceae bacterium]
MYSFLDLWNKVCTKIQNQINNVAYGLWIENLVPYSFERGVFLLQAPSEFHQKVVLENYCTIISKALEEIIGLPVEVKITSAEVLNSEPEIEEDSSDYTFDNYVVGESNKFAYAASQAVADKPGQSYNPLFIYGGSGLGKTHLLYAIISKIKDSNPDQNIVYIKGDEFTNELISSLKVNAMIDFHKKYRSIDVLLIDDVQFIGGKESTQEEFFHTFNTLYQEKKQIIITSDRPPKEIKTLEDRLRTRFEWGLLADIQPPDYETRLAIIKRKAETIGLYVDNDTAEYIANRIKTNIRQLEGTVQKLKAYHHLNGEKISIHLAQKSIKDILSDSQPLPVTIEKIISEVARTYEVTPEEICSKKRSAKISTARQVAIYVVRDVTSISLEQIGLEFGGRDHSTVVYALNQINKAMESNRTLQSTIEDIIKNIKST